MSADDWPMFHHDADHTGVTTDNGPLSDISLWNFTAANVVGTSPAVANGYVYFGSGSEFSSPGYMVYCLNAQSGNLVWNFTLGSAPTDPTVSNGYVYVGSINNYLYCLNAITGALVWNYSAGLYVSFSDPTVSNGYVYVGTNELGALCINATTGALVWKFATQGDAGTPSIYGSNVYVGGSPTVYCLDASTGTQVWNYTLSSGAAGTPVVYNGNVYFGAGGAYIYNYNVTCLNAQTGAFVWNFTVYEGVSHTVAAAKFFVVGGIDGSDLFRRQIDSQYFPCVSISHLSSPSL